MNHLHNLTQNPVAYVWSRIVGGNGVALTKGLAHLHRIERRTDIPQVPQGTMGPGDYRYDRAVMNRWYWSPWTLTMLPTRELTLTPLCGRIKSTSIHPYLETAYDGDWRTNGTCPNCETAAREAGHTPQYLAEVQAKDPWTQVRTERRHMEPDPINGM